MPQTWYVARDAKQYGPISDAEFVELVKRGHLSASDLVWHEGLTEWSPATNFLPGQHQTAEQSPVVAPEAPDQLEDTSESVPTKNRVRSAVIFGVFILLLTLFIAWLEPQSFPYRLGAGLTGAVFGGIGGAIAGMLSFLIERFFQRTVPRSWKIGAVSAGFLLGAGFGKLSEIGVDLGVGQIRDAAYQEVVRPRIDRAFIQRSLRNAGDAGRLYRLIEEKEPSTFDAIVEVLVANLRSDATQDQVIGLMREQLIERISKPRMKYLDDEGLLLMFALTADMVEALARTNPPLCLAVVQGKPFGDLRPYVGSDLARREQAIMERMIGAVQREFTLLPGAELQQINNRVAIELYKRHGDALSVLDPANQTPARAKEACAMFAEYVREVLRLPRAEALALLRALAVDPDRLG